MEKKNVIVNILKNMDADSLVSIWNSYCNDENPDDYIYSNDEYTLKDLFGDDVNEAIRAAYYGDYRYGDTYVKFNAYDNLESMDEYNVSDKIDFDSLADYLIDNGNFDFEKENESELWCGFREWYEETYGKELDENWDTFDNLLTDDWEDIAEGIEDENSEEEA